MRLKNKKTGEIVVASVTRVVSGVDFDCGQTLAELNSEWEDAPEKPKEYWFVADNGLILTHTDGGDSWTRKFRKEIGNCFSSREEAEKAVERLRAWKRLKDFGCGFMLDDHFTVKFVGPDARKITLAEKQKSLSDAYKLLFGGEE